MRVVILLATFQVLLGSKISGQAAGDMMPLEETPEIDIFDPGRPRHRRATGGLEAMDKWLETRKKMVLNKIFDGKGGWLDSRKYQILDLVKKAKKVYWNPWRKIFKVIASNGLVRLIELSSKGQSGPKMPQRPNRGSSKTVQPLDSNKIGSNDALKNIREWNLVDVEKVGKGEPGKGPESESEEEPELLDDYGDDRSNHVPAIFHRPEGADFSDFGGEPEMVHVKNDPHAFNWKMASVIAIVVSVLLVGLLLATMHMRHQDIRDSAATIERHRSDLYPNQADPNRTQSGLAVRSQRSFRPGSHRLSRSFRASQETLDTSPEFNAANGKLATASSSSLA